MTTLLEIIKDCTTDLEWRSSSQWATPHPNDLYTSEVKVYDSPEVTEFASFHVNGMRLILCKKAAYPQHDSKFVIEVTYYDMGEFTEPIASSLSQLEDAANKIKEYAAYVIEGFKKHGDLRHCPSFEMIDDVDDNFNPIA